MLFFSDCQLETIFGRIVTSANDAVDSERIWPLSRNRILGRLVVTKPISANHKCIGLKRSCAGTNAAGGVGGVKRLDRGTGF
jgi:hypothetical protein